MREHFAVCLREQGIEANATQRWQRGMKGRSLEQSEFHNVRKVQTDKERARMHAIARKKKTLLLKTMQNRLHDVERSARSGKPVPDHPGILKAKAKRQELTDLLNDVINELNAGSSQDKMLALATKELFEKLPPVKSAVQEAD